MPNSMNILVIKQTSLGDVLHASGHIRSIKQNFPDCRLVLLTASNSADLYRHNPYVDEIILFEHQRIKRDYRRHPLHAIAHVAEVIATVRAQHFDLAFDLQGLARSVIFLYAARADKKYVKGNWLGLDGFRKPALHAIAEMDGVLKRAGLSLNDTAPELYSGADAQQHLDALLADINPENKPMLIFSPFSRWHSKDWSLDRYFQLATRLADRFIVVFTGAAESRERIEQAMPPDCSTQIINLAGKLSLLQFAELVSRARAMLSGDSFPMHVACAKNTPVVALFAPTDESKTGPIGAQHQVIRAPNCNRCDRSTCSRDCLNAISTDTVFEALNAQLG